MRPDPRKYLWDALRAAERLDSFRQGKSFADYRSDDLLKSAVERQFEIIGEASVPPAQLTTRSRLAAASWGHYAAAIPYRPRRRVPLW